MSFFDEGQLHGDRPVNDGIDEGTRDKIRELYGLQELQLMHQVQLLKMKRAQLEHPTPAGENAIQDYMQLHLSPLGERTAKLKGELALQLVDIEGLKAALPLALMSVARHVNLPLLMELTGAEPAQAKILMQALKEFFENGFGDQ